MTDAERWRWIAKEFDEGDCAWEGLCIATAHMGNGYSFEQERRMDTALELFAPDGNLAYWWGRDGDKDYDPGARVLAALFLSAMAEADGGNHKEDS